MPARLFSHSPVMCFSQGCSSCALLILVDTHARQKNCTQPASLLQTKWAIEQTIYSMKNWKPRKRTAGTFSFLWNWPPAAIETFKCRPMGPLTPIGRICLIWFLLHLPTYCLTLQPNSNTLWCVWVEVRAQHAAERLSISEEQGKSSSWHDKFCEFYHHNAFHLNSYTSPAVILNYKFKHFSSKKNLNGFF